MTISYLSQQNTATHNYTTTEIEKRIVSSVVSNISLLQKKIIPFIHKTTGSVLTGTQQNPSTVTSLVEIESVSGIFQSYCLENEDDELVELDIKPQPTKRFTVKAKVNTIKKAIPKIYPDEFEL